MESLERKCAGVATKTVAEASFEQSTQPSEGLKRDQNDSGLSLLTEGNPTSIIHEDCEMTSLYYAEEFQNIPKTPPSLGVKVGHDRRDLAVARKCRPPTRKVVQVANLTI